MARFQCSSVQTAIAACPLSALAGRLHPGSGDVPRWRTILWAPQDRRPHRSEGRRVPGRVKTGV